ncbi:hypothetical protein BDZ89DRAFT_142049 [Hymenopellis radicata]|nr:hypothetical protein BDZ89DRAFT_142049 [Hymenopellis radicata]
MLPENRPPFSPLAFLFCILCIALSLIIRPTFARSTLFFPTAASAIYLLTTTTGSAPHDDMIGFVYVSCIMTASDYMLISEPQRDFRRVGQREESIETAPLWDRVKWGFKLWSSIRGIGWQHEPNVFPRRAAPGTPRVYFIGRQIVGILGWMIVWDLATMYGRQCPAFAKEGISFRERPWFWRTVDMFVWVLMPMANANISVAVFSVVSVTMKLSRPEDWTSSIGKWSDAYTLRRFWGRVWHQYLRKFLSAHGQFVTRRVLNLQPGTKASSYVQLYVAFILSALMHWLSEVTQLYDHWSQSTASIFFPLQAVGITFEDGVIAIAQKWGIKAPEGAPPLYLRAVGYLWTYLWFAMVGPIWWDALHRAGFLEALYMPKSLILGVWKGKWEY